MKYYFIDDENGTIFSEDKTRRFRMLSGREAMAFFQTPRGKGTRFMEQKLDDADDVYLIEMPKGAEVEYREDENHQDYLRRCKAKAGYEEVSYYGVLGKDGTETGEEMFEDASANVEEFLFRKMEISILYDAVKSLSDQEKEIISALFLNDTPVSERALASKLGIPQKTMNYRKTRALEKIRKYF